MTPMTTIESKSNFLWKSLGRGLLWFSILITAYIVAEEHLKTNFQSYIEAAQANSVDGVEFAKLV